MNNYEFIITNHLRERFVERFTENRKLYSHLRNCSGCPKCVSLTFKLQKEVREKGRFLDKVICAKLHDAKEVRIHHNNAEYMEFMVKKYGDRKFQFLVNEDILFVVVIAEKGKVVVTCENAKKSVLGDFVRRPKFKKRVKDFTI